jgi:hypothetical protein
MITSLIKLMNSIGVSLEMAELVISAIGGVNSSVMK